MSKEMTVAVGFDTVKVNAFRLHLSASRLSRRIFSSSAVDSLPKTQSLKSKTLVTNNDTITQLVIFLASSAVVVQS